MVSGTGKTPGTMPFVQVRLVGVAAEWTAILTSSLRPVAGSSSPGPGDSVTLALSVPFSRLQVFEVDVHRGPVGRGLAFSEMMCAATIDSVIEPMAYTPTKKKSPDRMMENLEAPRETLRRQECLLVND